jgi:Fur family transcriptional regulator, ferric uptake regulator
MDKKEFKDIFIKYLKDNGQRITNERILILNSALSMEDHFDADELYTKMRNDFIRVSRATVYNTLELMNNCSILSKHNFKGERARYEAKRGSKNHYHIICISCNKIIEFENQSIDKSLLKVCKDKDLKLLDYSIQVFATCDSVSECKIGNEPCKK